MVNMEIIFEDIILMDLFALVLQHFLHLSSKKTVEGEIAAVTVGVLVVDTAEEAEAAVVVEEDEAAALVEMEVYVPIAV